MSTTNCNSLTDTTPCTSGDCGCKVLISSDCVNKVDVDLACASILKGQTLSEVLTQLDAYICQRFESVENFVQLANIGTGSQIYKGVNIFGKKELRTLLESNLVSLVQGTETITVSINEAALAEFIRTNQSNTVVTPGTNITVEGDGSTGTPYVINATNTGVASVTGTQVNNTDPLNPIIEDAVLERLDEGNGSGVRFFGKDPTFYGNIGLDAIDLSYSDADSPTLGTDGATGESSFAVGNYVKTSGFSGVAFGNSINSAGFGSFSCGTRIVESGYSNNVFGVRHQVASLSATVVGQAANIISEQILDWNATPTKALFTVGNGTIQNADFDYTALTRSDAFQVRLNGSVEAPSLTTSLIDADVTGKILTTKEWVTTNIGAAQTLQSVLDTGNSASFDGGTSTIDMFIPTIGGRVISFYTQDGTVDSGFTMQSGGVKLIGNSSALQSSIGVRNGELDISTFNLVTNVNTKVTTTPPLVNSTLNFPAKSVEGTYTLATLDDIPSPQDISGKVDKVSGSSLIADTEITRLASVSNYTHPANHPPSIITQDASNRFVTDTEKSTWNAKVSVTQVTGQVLTAANWTLVSGFYEYNLANANVTATSIVNAIPDNASYEIVKTAEILPRTDSSTGSVKLYSKNLPGASITITINILK